ncbi:Alpha/beta hydrolase family protein [Labrenzia sp. THAF191b]|uniref:alpha/beta hydrolase family protein n=1 Tax=unclassified Labrenzia TaxID=2648686 RepID=UPI0012690DFD|nr:MULTISPECIES: alpha/beta fold hydrolase [unclassified Labrenzia]QFS96312.1 Alpha/beta hydrolase family protein [Labrenzia sp. THAF191b]QFT02627.1 Alpha/beta hydrolase family protein [Labrenzia sp. THAF191a]QFT14169.1 Alpha/beta hydrolase family protein [Labrenzia sp. THAF187b]
MLQERNPRVQNVAISAEGAELQGSYYRPQGAVLANLVLHGATGVQQYFYRAFATWAAERGFGVLTYDYRDFGRSAFRPMRQSKATFADWAVLDQAAAERTLADLAPDGPLWVVGHSLGGLGFPFRRHDARVERITTVGAGFGHFSDHPWSYRPKVLAFWFLLGPLGTSVAGYLPGRQLLLGEDLPAGVYWQWRKWCTSRDFFRSDIGASLPDPDFGSDGPKLRMLTMKDDVVVPPVAVKRYADSFPNERVDFQMLHASDYGLKALGHIEVFSRRNAPIWPVILEPK